MRALIALVVVTQVALLVWLAVPREHVHAIHTTTTTIVKMHVPLPIETLVETQLDHARCPPPRRDVPRGKLVQPPEEIEVVRPSVTNAGWIAAWNDDHVFVSTNGGASWKRTHDGDGTVRDVNFDCFGRPIVIRGSTPHLSDDNDVVILGGGPDIVIVGAAPRGEDDLWRARIVVSHDRGLTWQQRDLVESWETPVYGRQYEDGSIATLVHEGDCGGQSPYVFGFDQRLAPKKMTTLDAYYELSAREGGIDGVDAYHIDTNIVEGPHPIVVANGRAYRYANGKATALPVEVSTHASYFAADAAGRIWGVGCGKLVIARETRGSGPRAGSSGAADAAGCDPS